MNAAFDLTETERRVMPKLNESYGRSTIARAMEMSIGVFFWVSAEYRKKCDTCQALSSSSGVSAHLGQILGQKNHKCAPKVKQVRPTIQGKNASSEVEKEIHTSCLRVSSRFCRLLPWDPKLTQLSIRVQWNANSTPVIN